MIFYYFKNSDRAESGFRFENDHDASECDIFVSHLADQALVILSPSAGWLSVLLNIRCQH